jgi:hypothetical protein
LKDLYLIITGIATSFLKEIDKEEDDNMALRKFSLMLLVFIDNSEELPHEIKKMINYALTQFRPIAGSFKDNKHDFIFGESLMRGFTNDKRASVFLSETLVHKIINDHIANKN